MYEKESDRELLMGYNKLYEDSNIPYSIFAIGDFHVILSFTKLGLVNAV
jgi:hypothetical protein